MQPNRRRPGRSNAFAPPHAEATRLAEVEEFAVEVIDGEMKKLDGEVTRRPVDEVMNELEAAEEAADAAAHRSRCDLGRGADGSRHGDPGGIDCPDRRESQMSPRSAGEIAEVWARL